jgi:hypothetical protein
MYQIHKISVRRALPSEKEAYWSAPIRAGLHLGFRKTGAVGELDGTWLGRKFDPDTGKHKTGALFVRDSTPREYDAVLVRLAEWSALQDAGITTDEVVTLADACRAYVVDRRREKGETTAHAAEMIFKATIYDDALGKRPLLKVRASLFNQWRDRQTGTPATKERKWRYVRAAINCAMRNRHIPAALIQEWRDVRPLKGHAGKRRELFLDLAQRRALLAAAKGNVRHLIEAVILIGARAGELTSARRSQFDARLKTLSLTGKTGTRTIPLSEAALAFFEQLAKSKLPAAYLFVRDDGLPWAHSDWDRLVRDAAREADLPSGTHLYALRHSFISQYLNDGLNTLDVARLCGTSLQMIEKNYGQVSQAALRERMAKVAML